ncbi:zinc finger protein 574 [Periophthalmus magnuspinnatus]|uniref:zinc finger protein 574 n=1 Tax=Periophthalmus magnuspinnatus TaxID=409849 RepID=UPI00145BAAD7|nr:zinc finger protein 574 [Periophthalmus magnuspinnatus]
MAGQQDEAEDVYVEHQYMCSECHELFNTLEDVLVHQQIHTAPEGEEAVNAMMVQDIPEVGQNQQYQCLECGTLLVNADELLQHQEMHMREVGAEMRQDLCEVEVEVNPESQASQPVQYQCLDCLALFNSPETWLEHRRTHSRSVTHTNIDSAVEYVLQPDGTITPLNNVQNHVLSEEQAKEILAQVFAQQQQQKKRYTSSRPVQPTRPSLLPSVTPAPGSATMHLQILTAQALADRSSSPRSKLYSSVSGSKVGRIENGVQRLELRLAPNIQNVAHHPQSTEMVLLSHPYECSECSLLFNTPEDFLQHQGEHFLAQDKESEETGVMSSFDEARVREELAEKATEIRLSIKENKSSVWSNPQKCDLCHRTFASASRLAIHRRVHEQGTYECSECGKMFKRPMSLEIHMRTHTGVARFLCVDCGQGFATELTLITHRKSHTANPFYKCTFCDKVFTSMTKQLYHRRIHLNHDVSAPTNTSMISAPKRASISALAILQKVREKKNSLWAPMEQDQVENLNSSDPQNLQTKEGHNEESQVIHSMNVSIVDNDNIQKTAVSTEPEQTVLSSPEENAAQTESTDSPAVSTDNSSFSCRSCSKTFSSQKQLVHHRRKAHAAECSFVCGICGKSFKKQIHVNNHIRTHTGERPYQCSDCGKTFTLLANLIRHNLIHSGVKPYRCEVCHRSFSQSSNLRNHSLLHSSAAVLSCPDCPAKFRWPAKLAVHRFNQHPGSPAPFSCPRCEAGFINMRQRDAHCFEKHSILVGTVTESEKKNHNAPTCPDTTPQPSTSFTKEAQPAEQAITGRSLDCNICGKKLNSSANLRLHRLSHFAVGPGRPGKRPKAHQCPVCGKQFVSSSGVALHQRVHTGERPFPCQVCGKRFRQNTHLREHLRTHSGERPFTCEVCHKSFIQSMHLAEHRRTHTGERPHVCPLCGKAFKTFSNLRSHKKTHARQQQLEQATTPAAMETETAVAVADSATVEMANGQPQVIQIQTTDIQQIQGTPTIMCNEFGETIAIIETSEGGALPLEQALEIYQAALENGLGLDGSNVERLQLL